MFYSTSHQKLWNDINVRTLELDVWRKINLEQILECHRVPWRWSRQWGKIHLHSCSKDKGTSRHSPDPLIQKYKRTGNQEDDSSYPSPEVWSPLPYFGCWSWTMNDQETTVPIIRFIIYEVVVYKLKPIHCLNKNQLKTCAVIIYFLFWAHDN